MESMNTFSYFFHHLPSLNAAHLESVPTAKHGGTICTASSRMTWKQTRHSSIFRIFNAAWTGKSSKSSIMPSSWKRFLATNASNGKKEPWKRFYLCCIHFPMDLDGGTSFIVLWLKTYVNGLKIDSLEIAVPTHPVNLHFPIGMACLSVSIGATPCLSVGKITPWAMNHFKKSTLHHTTNIDKLEV